MDYREKLEKLLEWDCEEIVGKDVYVWGTGNIAQLYFEGLKRLEKEEDNSIKIKGYCDNNPEKWNLTFGDKVIYAPKELLVKDNVYFMICSPQKGIVNAIRKQIKEAGKECGLMDEIVLKLHKKEILDCFDNLYDDRSREIYYKVIKSRIDCEPLEEKDVSFRSYFGVYPFGEARANEVFVDCGAFVGDTIENYMFEKNGIFKKIYAFEPDAINRNALKKRINRLSDEWNFELSKVEICDCAVGARNEILAMERDERQNGLGSKIGQFFGKEEKIHIVSLDEYIKEKITLLKADVESYEFNMIQGAKNHIMNEKPYISVCIYHNAVDLYSIQLLLAKLVPEYHFAIRQHRFIFETVLYAWID